MARIEFFVVNITLVFRKKEAETHLCSRPYRTVTKASQEAGPDGMSSQCATLSTDVTGSLNQITLQKQTRELKHVKYDESDIKTRVAGTKISFILARIKAATLKRNYIMGLWIISCSCAD